MLAVDGTEPQELRKMMQLEIDNQAEYEDNIPKVFESAGGFSPTIGIIGAVLGLIQVMQHLDNINEVGKGIAVAFVATVYGVGSANLFFLPSSGKLRLRIREEQIVREMTLEGVISILEGMNPRMLETKLVGFLQGIPASRQRRRQRSGDEGPPAHALPSAMIAGWFPMPTLSPCCLRSSWCCMPPRRWTSRRRCGFRRHQSAFQTWRLSERTRAAAAAGRERFADARTPNKRSARAPLSRRCRAPAGTSTLSAANWNALWPTRSSATTSPCTWKPTAWSSACARWASSTAARPHQARRRGRLWPRRPDPAAHSLLRADRRPHRQRPDSHLAVRLQLGAVHGARHRTGEDRLIEEYGVSADRLSAAGYAEFHPVVSKRQCQRPATESPRRRCHPPTRSAESSGRQAGRRPSVPMQGN